eukprot:COSAG04_NODE_3117_length_3150_cov_27.676172_2_plen_237_part_00
MVVACGRLRWPWRCGGGGGGRVGTRLGLVSGGSMAYTKLGHAIGAVVGGGQRHRAADSRQQRAEERWQPAAVGRQMPAARPTRWAQRPQLVQGVGRSARTSRISRQSCCSGRDRPRGALRPGLTSWRFVSGADRHPTATRRRRWRRHSATIECTRRRAAGGRYDSPVDAWPVPKVHAAMVYDSCVVCCWVSALRLLREQHVAKPYDVAGPASVGRLARAPGFGCVVGDVRGDACEH